MSFYRYTNKDIQNVQYDAADPIEVKLSKDEIRNHVFLSNYKDLNLKVKTYELSRAFSDQTVKLVFY